MPTLMMAASETATTASATSTSTSVKPPARLCLGPAARVPAAGAAHSCMVPAPGVLLAMHVELELAIQLAFDQVVIVQVGVPDAGRERHHFAAVQQQNL